MGLVASSLDTIAIAHEIIGGISGIAALMSSLAALLSGYAAWHSRATRRQLNGHIQAEPDIDPE